MKEFYVLPVPFYTSTWFQLSSFNRYRDST